METRKNKSQRVVMTSQKFADKISKARKYLMDKGIVSIDGSGQEDVEALFTMLTWFRYGRLKIIKE